MTLPGLRRMYFVDAHCRVNGGYAPRIIIEGDANRYTIGNHENPHPYVWGPTLDDAKREAKFRNVSEFKLEPETQEEIIRSHFLALDATEYPSVAAAIFRDGEALARMKGYRITIPKRPVHMCDLPPVEGAVYYYLIRFEAEDADGWGPEDFLTTNIETFRRRYGEIKSSGLPILAVEFLTGTPMNMGEPYA